jgi:uncharacterized membrane protein YidH (DUF202 family)
MHEAKPGVHTERTALAWQRTAVALLAGAAIVARLVLVRLGEVAVVCVVVALPVTLWVLWEGRSRYRREAVPRALRAPTDWGGARTPAALAAATALIALIELTALICDA